MTITVNGNKYAMAWEYAHHYRRYHWELMEVTTEHRIPYLTFKTQDDAIDWINQFM